MNMVHQYSTNLGLKINIGKTEVQVISRRDIEVKININNTDLKQVEHFVYLGGKISKKGTCTEDIQLRIGKALGAMQSINDILNSKEISRPTKMELYSTLIMSILLYGSETWTLKKDDENRLLVFEMTCLRKILGVTRLDKI